VVFCEKVGGNPGGSYIVWLLVWVALVVGVIVGPNVWYCWFLCGGNAFVSVFAQLFNVVVSIGLE
jgi:hypothetical protein